MMSVTNVEVLENEVAARSSLTDKCELTTEAVINSLKSLSSKGSTEKVQNFMSLHNSSNVLASNEVSLKDLLRNRLSSQYILDDHSSSLFCEVELAFPRPIAKLKSAFIADKNLHKINLGKEEYHSEKGLPKILNVVKYVQAQMARDPLLVHEHLPILGLTSFCEAATEFCLGKDSIAIVENRAGTIQALSRSGALRLAAEFLFTFYNKREDITSVYFPQQTWENHVEIFKKAGFTNICYYRYWNYEERCLNSAGMIFDLNDAQPFSIVVLQACAHNPTGCDPTWEDWELIARICFERRLFPVFDNAYQGLASGDPDVDAWSIRNFVRLGFEMLICQSFAKPFSLYDEKVGSVILIFRDSVTKMKCVSQFQKIIGTMYSNPPSHGARIVASILNNSALYEEWLNDLSEIVSRMNNLRQLLHSKLRVAGTPGCWNHIVKQHGMFSYIGLTSKQVNYLMNKSHIYMLDSSLVNISCLTEDNIDYFAQCIDEAVRLS